MANTRCFTKIIEDYVRRYPDQWLWVHRRWKTRPRASRRCISRLQIGRWSIGCDGFRHFWLDRAAMVGAHCQVLIANARSGIERK